jgi:hypothetical protein
LKLPDAALLFESFDVKQDVDYLASRTIKSAERFIEIANAFLSAATRIVRGD